MALDTADKRFAAVNIASPARGIHIFPSGSVDAEARLALLHLGAVLAAAPVTVPDVVGQSQASGTAEIEAEGLVVAVQTAHSSTVPAGDIISQSPAAGSEVSAGSTVTITVSLGEAPKTGAGRKRRKRRQYVEIDGQEFEVASPAEAMELLARARDVAKAQIEKARAAPIRVNRGIARPRITTQSPELKAVVKQARDEITSLYDAAIRDFEIAALMRAAEDEEEEELIRLLM